MSALGQKRTLHLFNHLVSTCEHGRRHGEAEGLGRLEIDHQLVLGRRLHWKVGWLLALEDAVDVAGRAPELVGLVLTITVNPSPFSASSRVSHVPPVVYAASASRRLMASCAAMACPNLFLRATSAYNARNGLGETVLGTSQFAPANPLRTAYEFIMRTRDRVRRNGLKAGVIEASWDIGYMRQVRTCLRER